MKRDSFSKDHYRREERDDDISASIVGHFTHLQNILPQLGSRRINAPRSRIASWRTFTAEDVRQVCEDLELQWQVEHVRPSAR